MGIGRIELPSKACKTPIFAIRPYALTPRIGVEPISFLVNSQVHLPQSLPRHISLTGIEPVALPRKGRIFPLHYRDIIDGHKLKSLYHHQTAFFSFSYRVNCTQLH